MKEIDVNFYIWGMVTHVGQCFNGINAAMLAAQLAFYFCEKEEFHAKVVELFDLKTEYNVQTPADAFLKLNILSPSKETVTTLVPEMIAQAVDSTIFQISERYFQYCEQTGFSFSPISYPIRKIAFTSCKNEFDMKTCTIVEQMKSFFEKQEEISPTVLYFIDEEICERNS